MHGILVSSRVFFASVRFLNCCWNVAKFLKVLFMSSAGGPDGSPPASLAMTCQKNA
jgi:hypothetical protein